MKLCFFSANFVPHHEMLIRELVENHQIEIHSFYISENYTYIPDNIRHLFLYKKTEFSKKEILDKILQISPSLLFVAGYNNKDFLWISKKIKKISDIPVVCGSDTQWRGTLKQKIRMFFSPITIRPAFTHFKVAGVYQYEWARKLGFKKEQILFDMLSGDANLFGSLDIEIKKKNYPKNFVFIGRFIGIKGIQILLDAWSDIVDKKGWTLTFIGDGELNEQMQKRNDIDVKKNMSQVLLLKELENAGCHILSSTFEQWGLVVHETACAGLPIICTNVCGAAPHFVINGYNGYLVEPGNANQLRVAMEKIIHLPEDELIKMSYNSRKLGVRITQEISAASLLSVIK